MHFAWKMFANSCTYTMYVASNCVQLLIVSNNKIVYTPTYVWITELLLFKRYYIVKTLQKSSIHSWSTSVEVRVDL